MKRLAGAILWIFLFLALLLAVDQIFLRTPFEVGGLREVRLFYVDFRSRLFKLPVSPLPSKPTEIVEKGEKSVAKEGKLPPPPRFVYADEGGNLQFVHSLEEVPTRFRREAKPLEP